MSARRHFMIGLLAGAIGAVIGICLTWVVTIGRMSVPDVWELVAFLPYILLCVVATGASAWTLARFPKLHARMPWKFWMGVWLGAFWLLGTVITWCWTALVSGKAETFGAQSEEGLAMIVTCCVCTKLTFTAIVTSIDHGRSLAASGWSRQSFPTIETMVLYRFAIGALAGATAGMSVWMVSGVISHGLHFVFLGLMQPPVLAFCAVLSIIPGGCAAVFMTRGSKAMPLAPWIEWVLAWLVCSILQSMALSSTFDFDEAKLFSLAFLSISCMLSYPLFNWLVKMVHAAVLPSATGERSSDQPGS